MTLPNTDKVERIRLMVSFLDEDNEDILTNIENELLSLDPEGNNLLINEIVESNNYKVKERLLYISRQNLLRFFEHTLYEWIESKDKRIFEFLFIIAQLEYPALDKEALLKFYDKILKKIWLKIESESSALEATQAVVTFLKINFQWKIFDGQQIKHLHINKVFSTYELCSPMLDYLFLAIAQDLGIPITALKYEKKAKTAFYRHLIFAFENKEPYTISFIQQPHLFYLLPQSLMPLPEKEIREKFNIDGDELNLTAMHAAEIAAIFINKLAYLYKQEKQMFYAEKLEGIVERIKET